MFTLLMELGKVAGKAIKAAIVEYKARGGDVTQGHLAVVILAELREWQPVHKGKAILSAPLRAQFASALAGLSYNIGAAEAGKGLV